MQRHYDMKLPCCDWQSAALVFNHSNPSEPCESSAMPNPQGAAAIQPQAWHHSLSLCGRPDVDATSVSCSTAGQLTCSLYGDRCWRELARHLKQAKQRTAW